MNNYKLDAARTQEDKELQNDFTAYVVKALQNNRMKYLMRQDRVRRHEIACSEEELSTIPADEASETVVWLLDSLENLSLLSALKSISEKELIILKLHVLYGMSFGAIGSVLDMPEATARSTYNRTVIKIRNRMECSQ